MRSFSPIEVMQVRYAAISANTSRYARRQRTHGGTSPRKCGCGWPEHLRSAAIRRRRLVRGSRLRLSPRRRDRGGTIGQILIVLPSAEAEVLFRGEQGDPQGSARAIQVRERESQREGAVGSSANTGRKFGCSGASASSQYC